MMKNKILLFLVSLIFLLSLISLGISLYRILGPVERTVFDVRFGVSDRIGFEMNTSGLMFGKMFPGGRSSRTISLHNDLPFPVKTKVRVTRNIQPYLSIYIPEKLGIDENYTFSAVLIIPEDMSYGNYSGKVIFEIWK